MNRIYLLLFLLSVNQAYASGCHHNFDQRHDFVAIVKIESESSEYQNAFNAEIEKVIYRYGENQENFDESKLFEIKPGKTFVLIESALVEEKGSRKLNTGRKVKTVKSIRSHSCEKQYRVGERVRLFANEVAPNIYKSSSSWTKLLD